MKTNKYLLENDLISGGGAEQITKQLVDKLLQEGHDVTVAVWKGNRKDFYRIYPRKVKYFLLEFPWLDGIRRFTLRWLLQRFRFAFFCFRKFLLDREKFDIAIAMKEGPCMKDIANRNAKKHYGWVHVDYRYIYWTLGTFSSAENELKCFQQMDKVICVSQATANGVVKTIGDSGNLVVCYNPIDVARIQHMAKEKCTYSRDNNKPLFVSVGRLAKEKQFSMLLEACKCLSEKYEFELWLIGDGPEREKLRTMVEQRKIGCVKLLGAKENPYPYMKQADCFISSSLAESYGLAIQEAMILGIPVLVTECPAMWETVPEDCGVISPNNVEGLLDSMEMILNEPKYLECLRSNIRTRFDTKELYNARLDVIYHLLEE